MTPLSPPDPPTRRAASAVALSLVGLVLAAVLPLLVFGVGVAHHTVQQKQSALADELAGIARGLQVAIDRVLLSQLTAMEVLATDVSLDAGQLQAFQDRARRVVGAHADWRNVVLIDPRTHLIVASVLPLPDPPPSTSSPADVDAVASNRTSRIAGVYAAGRLVNKPIVLMLAPVVRADTVRWVLGVVMDPATLSQVFVEQQLPPSWTGAIVDDRMALAGRSRDAEHYLGVRATATLTDRIAARQHDMFTARTHEGELVYTVFSRSAATGWTVALGIPASEVEGPIHQTLVRMAAAGGVLVLLALMVTGAVGRGIVLRRRANELALQDELDMRRRIDAELRASRQRLQDFSSSSADWFWETGVDGRFTYLSDNFETTIGRYKEQLLGRTRAELLADDGLNPIEQVHAHAELLRRQQPFRSFEYRLLDGAGSVRWLSTSGLPVVDGDGQFAGYRGAGQDVTARRNAEGALEQGHRLLREAVENVASGFTIYDPQDRLVICNATYLDIYATSRDLIQPGARFEDIVRQGALRGQYPQAQGRVDAWVAERVRLHQNPTGRPIEQALDDGRWLLIVETRTPSGYIVGNRIDITDRKKAEAEVRKLSLAIEQCPASIFITDLQGRIEYANEAFVSNTGYPLDEVLGRKPSLLKSGQTPEATYRALWLALAGKQTWKGEFHNRRKDGSVHIDAAIVSPIHQADGRVSHYLGIQEDVTESRRQAEELERHRHRLEDLVASRTAQLVSALDAAQAASLAKSQFLANMSHEIRTPLNAISGLSHLIRRSGVNPEQATRLAKIETASRHLLAIISAILDLSKIEAGKLVLDDRELDLAATVGTVISMVSVDAAAKHIELRTDIDALPWRLRGDETRLQQALLNYVANAVKFTEAGSIDISLRGEAEQGDAVLVRFEVCDTGIGIAPDQQAGLFSVFQQADNSMTRRHGGTGLGLAITRRFAELMGGSAGLSSRLGQGSTFWFTARLMKAGAAVETTAPMPLPDLTHDALLRRDFSGRRVLLVEDNPVNQEVMIELLRDLDLTVELARDGVEAITMAETGRYDLMLMDMQMPRMGGMQATQRIRQLPACATLPILALTGNAFVEDRARCLEAGMNDFITKPIDPDSLAATLLHWLGRA